MYSIPDTWNKIETSSDGEGNPSWKVARSEEQEVEGLGKLKMRQS